MAEQEEELNTTPAETIAPSLPPTRVKKIMKLDKEINKVNSEALFLISCCTDLFLEFLAEESARVAIQKKRKTVNLEHLRVAVKRHRPTSDFLLESLPVVSEPAVDRPKAAERSRARTAEKPVPAAYSIPYLFLISTFNKVRIRVQGSSISIDAAAMLWVQGFSISNATGAYSMACGHRTMPLPCSLIAGYNELPFTLFATPIGSFFHSAILSFNNQGKFVYPSLQ